MSDFDKYDCSIKCGDNEDAERIDSYDELINKIRESRSDRTQIIFCDGDGKEVSFYLDCVSGCKGERNIYQKGSQIEFLGFSVATPNSEGGKDVKYYELDNYNYPVVNKSLMSIDKSVEDFFNAINQLMCDRKVAPTFDGYKRESSSTSEKQREYRILPILIQSDIAKSQFIYKTNGELGLPITSLIFLLCDAARIEPCFEISKKINSGSSNEVNGNSNKNGNPMIHDTNEDKGKSENKSFTINSLSNYVNEYGKCYKFTFGTTSSRQSMSDENGRQILFKGDYDLYELDRLFQNVGMDERRLFDELKECIIIDRKQGSDRDRCFLDKERLKRYPEVLNKARNVFGENKWKKINEFFTCSVIMDREMKQITRT